ncbi:MAG: TPM domain-containing protein [Rhodoferax sp.]|nr:TPM domain-containing protein [Rhodoferax sp.]MDP3651709.1 TPM domain-containing protein [Rhodoferax sp.]
MWIQLKRLFKHRWVNDSIRTLAPDAVLRLTQQVARSEQSHSGEIRLCIEAGLPNHYLLANDGMDGLVRRRAVDQFGELRVWDTAENNGVLIYLLLAERRIEVVADRGLSPYVSSDAWLAMVHRLGSALHDGRFEAGLAQAIDEVSGVLRAHFALAEGANNPNELADTPLLR